MSRPPRGQLSVQQLEDRTVPATVSMLESVFDPVQFETNLRERLENNVVGFAYSIREHGAQPLDDFTEYTGAWGLARTLIDTEDMLGRAMTVDSSMEVASVSKTITGTAIMRLFQEQIGATDDLVAALEAKLDQKMVDFLPADWQWLPNGAESPAANQQVGAITIRQLLRHQSGFETYALGYDYVKDVVETGITGTLGAGFYSTTNFSILREILPYLWEDVVDRRILDGADGYTASDLPEYLQTALESLYPDTSVNDLTPAQLSAGIYNYYVRAHVLEPAGIDSGDTKPAAGAESVLVYDFPDGGGHGEDPGDQTPYAGGRGWNLSAEELQLFLTAARYDNELLSPITRQVMFENDLGWETADTPFGPAYKHSGGNFAGTDTEDATNFKVNTYAITFPNDVNAALVVNSQLGNGLPGPGTIVYDAYKAAWPVLVIEGDSGANTFLLRASELDPNHMELLVDGELLMTLHEDVLQSLTLRGLGGNDTFQIEILPSGMELVLDGGTGADTFQIGEPNALGTVHGSVTVIGGSGTDTITANDVNGGPAPDTYKLTDDSLDWTGFDEPLSYSSIEAILLTGSHLPNTFVITGPLSVSTVTVHASGGNDTFTVSGVGAETELNLYGEGNEDTFNILSSRAKVNAFGDPDGLPFGWADTLALGAGDLNDVTGTVEFHGGLGQDSIVLNDKTATSGRAATFYATSITAGGYFPYTGVENITYHGTGHDDHLVVRSLERETALELFGYAGGDTFLVSDVTHDVDAVLGTLIVHGDAGATTHIAPGKSDTLAVYDDKNAEPGEYHVESALAVVGIIEKPLLGPVGQPHDRVRVEYDGVENADLFAGTEDDVIEVESTPMFSSLAVHTGTGKNTVFVSPTAKTLDTLLGALSVSGDGTDSLAVDDRNSAALAPYILDAGHVVRGPLVLAYASIEKVTLWVNPNSNLIAVNGTAPGSTTAVFGNTGNDLLLANAPAGAVHFWAGAGIDTARFIGTSAADAFGVQGEVISLGTGLLVTNGVEQREIDGLGLTDTLSVQGVSGVNEQFHIQPSQIAYEGKLVLNPHAPIRYYGVENFRVDANPADLDTLRVEGRTHNAFGLSLYDDVFNINLSAAGTSKDPVLNLRDAANVEYLRLLDFTGLSGVDIDGLGGNDTFEVILKPVRSSVSRAVRIHGSGNALAGDTLNVYYAPPKNVVELDDGLGSGGVYVDYWNQSYGIEFDGIEDWNTIPL